MLPKEEIEQLVKEILDDTQLRLRVDSYAVHDNLETRQVELRCEVHDAITGERNTIEGRGVGMVDALFHGTVALFSDDFPSLHTIKFADFSIRAHLDTGRANALSDSHAEVTLRVANSDGREFDFTDVSPSITRSSVSVVLAAAEFFINSERAFIQVYRGLRHAREENRNDTVAAYTKKLSTLVEATSYTEVIEQIKREEALGS